MTRFHFNQVLNNFSEFAGKEVQFDSFIPSANKYAKRYGNLKGIGTDANTESLLISNGGMVYAVHYTRVDWLNFSK